MNTFQLECFLVVANTLSFARAAEQLKVSQPTITHQIKSLENELNVKLFNRSTRMVEITPEGQSFTVDAKSILGIAGQARMRFFAADDRPPETLGIGCSNHVQLRLLPECLHRLNARAVNLHPRLLVVPREQLFQLLDTERADVVFDIQGGNGTKGRVKFKELVQSDIVCVCRKDAAAAAKERVGLRELTEESLIFCNPMNMVPELADLQWKLSEGRNPLDVHFSASSEEALVLAKAGIGMAILPELYLRGVEELVKIPLDGAPKFSYGMFYKAQNNDPLLKEFIKVTKAYFDEMYATSDR